MLKTSPSWRVTLPIAVLALTMLIPGAAEAASYRFKVNLSMVQTTGWEQTVRHPAAGEGYCGHRDVHWEYYGEGQGQLKAKIVGARVTFKGTRRALRSTEIKVPGTRVANAEDYTITQKGIPDEGCVLPQPPPHDAGDCNPYIPRPGTARSFLLVIGGRMNLTGGFYNRINAACADPSLYTGLLRFGGRPKRNDVNDLIANKRVRSIDLTASDTTVFGVKNLSDFGGSGKGNASWHVKLTRMR